jgi:hypothetical protein
MQYPLEIITNAAQSMKPDLWQANIFPSIAHLLWKLHGMAPVKTQDSLHRPLSPLEGRIPSKQLIGRLGNYSIALL